MLRERNVRLATVGKMAQQRHEKSPLLVYQALLSRDWHALICERSGWKFERS